MAVYIYYGISKYLDSRQFYWANNIVKNIGMFLLEGYILNQVNQVYFINYIGI